MILDKTCKLFFGCKIDSKLREALAQAKPGDRRYFEDPESPFLRLCRFNDERWIGKVMDPGLNVTEVEDIQRNVLSILRRIAPEVRKSPSTVKMFALAEEIVEKVDIEKDKPSEPSSNGPYIDNL